MTEQQDLHTLSAIIATMAEAANRADPSISEAVLWLDDPRFSEIEDFIAEPYGAQIVREIHAWVREHGEPGDHIRFDRVRLYQLAPTVAYATAIERMRFETESANRVTFLFLKIGERWGIIHAHYSAMPDDGAD